MLRIAKQSINMGKATMMVQETKTNGKGNKLQKKP